MADSLKNSDIAWSNVQVVYSTDEDNILVIENMDFPNDKSGKCD